MELSDITPAYGTALLLMLGALALFLVLFSVYLWQTGWGRGVPGRTLPLRPIPGYDAARQGMSRAAETGRAVHISPGTGGIGTVSSTASTLAGLDIVESMARVSAVTAAPVEATSNDAVAFALKDIALLRGYQLAGWSMEPESGGARFVTHDDPQAYVAGAAEVVTASKASHAVIGGQFGPEVLFLIEAQRRIGTEQIAGSSDPQAAALMTLTTRNPLVGEEIFASRAYLEGRKSHAASLLAQDGLRWAVILLVIGGFILVNVTGSQAGEWFPLYP
jgi:hypothetical protein